MNGELVRRLRDWLERGVPQGPYSLHLSPTMACDLNCLFCRRQDGLAQYYAENREIPDERYAEMVAEALAMGARVVVVKGGGEPLLRRELMRRIIPMVKASGAYGNLVTNGTRIDDALAEEFVRSGWDQVTISLDGPDPATHDALRGRAGVFEAVMAGIERVNASKRRAGAPLPLLGFHLVLTSRNFDRIGDMVELARARGVGHIELDSMSLRDESARSLLLGAEQSRRFAELLPDWIRLADSRGMTHNFGRFREEGYVSRAAAPERPRAGGIPCYYPWYQASITPGGGIVPCCYAEETHRSRVNLNETSFDRAWREGDPEEYRAGMSAGRLLPFCKDCTAMYADNNAEIRRWLEEAEHAGR